MKINYAVRGIIMYWKDETSVSGTGNEGGQLGVIKTRRR